MLTQAHLIKYFDYHLRCSQPKGHRLSGDWPWSI